MANRRTMAPPTAGCLAALVCCTLLAITTTTVGAVTPTGNGATCVLEATSNSGVAVTGTVTFQELSDTTLNVTVVANGLPDGNHGFHVHQYGDISLATGMSVGGHFVGPCNGCRPTGSLQEVGLLNNGVPLVSSGGHAYVNFIERVAKLNGTASILGRGLIIHGSPASTTIRMAQCVIGLSQYNPATPRAQRPAVTQATCRIRPTSAGSGSLKGLITMTASTDPNNPGVWFTLNVTNLSPGNHYFHVHDWGNIISPLGSAAGGHFIGNCPETNCRPPGVAQEIGMLFNGAGLTASLSGNVEAMVLDSVVRMSGEYSIIGRSLVIHGTASNVATRVAQCVIGEAVTVPPTDCAYDEWSGWSDCACISSGCFQTRFRLANQEPKNGGRLCTNFIDQVTCTVCETIWCQWETWQIAVLIAGACLVVLLCALSIYCGIKWYKEPKSPFARVTRQRQRRQEQELTSLRSSSQDQTGGKSPRV